MGPAPVRRSLLCVALTAAFASVPASTVGAGTLGRLPSLDTTFDGDGVVDLSPSSPVVPFAVAALPDGSTVVAVEDGVPPTLRKFRPDGSRDLDFGVGGVVQLPFSTAWVDIDPDGQIVVGASAPGISISLRRYTPAGVPDIWFVGDPELRQQHRPVAYDATSLVIAHETNTSGRACLSRLDRTEGRLVASFGTGGSVCVDLGATVIDVVATAQTDSTYVLAAFASNSRLTAVRISSTGQLLAAPTEWTLSGINIGAVVPTADGKVLAFDGTSLRRLLLDGSSDPTFAVNSTTPGRLALDGVAASQLELLPDGRVLAIGAAGSLAAAALVSTDGRLDGALQPGSSHPASLRLPAPARSWAPTDAQIVDVDLVGDRPVFVAAERKVGFDFEVLQRGASLVRGDRIGTSAPIGGGPVAGAFQPVVPERLLDTRPESQVGYSGAKPLPGAVIRLQVTGVGAAAVPADATAVVLNVTGTEATADGYVTVWPCGADRPLAANLNLRRGETRPNLVVARIGAGGGVCLYTQSGTHLIADISGFHRASSGYVAVVPERLLDTRPESRVAWTGDQPSSGQTVVLQVTGAGDTRVPATAVSVVLNLTAAAPEADGFVTAYPCDAPRPFTASLAVERGVTAPNLVHVRLSADGTVCLYTLRATHLIADISGYDTPTSTFVPITPERRLDTRFTADGTSTLPRPGAGSVIVFGPRPANGGTVAGRLPGDAIAVVINVTGTAAAADGYVTVYPCDVPRPLAANLNLVGGSTGANLVVVRLAGDGSVCAFTQSGTHLVVDVFGYYVLGA